MNRRKFCGPKPCHRSHHKRRTDHQTGKSAMTDALYFGDNLEVLHESIKDESVDLVCLVGAHGSPTR
jgi:hypothetical protein